MRNSNRIDRILKLIEKIWKKNPNLRLFQLLGNLYVAGDNYYREDDNLEKNLREQYEKDLK